MLPFDQIYEYINPVRLYKYYIFSGNEFLIKDLLIMRLPTHILRVQLPPKILTAHKYRAQGCTISINTVFINTVFNTAHQYRGQGCMFNATKGCNELPVELKTLPDIPILKSYAK